MEASNEPDEVVDFALKLFPQRPGFLLEFPSGAEYGDTVILYLHRISGLGISGFSSFSCLDFESAKTPQLDNPVLEKAVFNLFEE